MTMDADIIARARRYAGMGFAVHWLRPPTGNEAGVGKAPIEAGWQKHPKRSSEQIAAAYRQGANLGIRTGNVVGSDLALVVVDLDDADAVAWAQKNLPPTPIRTLTGRGEHWFYRHPGGTIRNGVKLRDRAIDVRGDGGQVVAPGSIHPALQKPYREGDEWTVEKLHALPTFERAWLADDARVSRAKVTASPAQALADGVAQIRSAREGERNDTLNRVAFRLGKFVEQGTLSADEVRGALTSAAKEAGLDDAEIASVLRESETGALRAGRRQPKRGHASQRSTAARLLKMIGEHKAELFVSDGEAFVGLLVDGHHETWRVRSRDFEGLLRRWFFQREKAAPRQPDLSDAIATLETQAMASGAVRQVYLRVGRAEGSLYLDLGGPGWRVVEVNAGGWRITKRPPVHFRRSRAMLGLPEPIAGGRIAELFECVNVAPEDQPLVLGWLVAALRPDVSLPLLAIHGEQGCGKSSLTKALRALIDPHTAEVRSTPREERSLMVGAQHSWLLAFDNLSSLPGWLSDMLCCLSTGGAYTARTLFTDEGETILRAQRPVILNGIGELATRSDLLDRSIVLSLPALPDRLRRPEADLRTRFEQTRPRLLGALLDAVACALRRLPTTEPANLPRMADFAVWATAAEPALGLGDGAFLAAYRENRASASEIPLGSTSLVEPLCRFLRQRAPEQIGGRLDWQGTAAELHLELSRLAGEDLRRQSDWPRNPQALATALRRLVPNLRQQGISVDFTRRGGGVRQRLITLAVEAEAGCVPRVPCVP